MSDKNSTCASRFCLELKPFQAWFPVKDPANGRKIDFPESFAPAGWIVLFWKLTAMLVTAVTFVVGWILSPAPGFYMAYLTNWTMVVSSIYIGFSFMNSVWSSRTPQPFENGRGVTLRIRITWALFAIAAHTSIAVAIMWWALIYDYGVTELNCLNVIPHGGVAVLVWIDGLAVNRIPVRMMHWYGFVLPFQLVYMVWSFVHSILEIGNPNENDNDPETNDDAIYEALAWNDAWVETLLFALLVIFGLGLTLYVVLWLVSLYAWPCCCASDRRRYLEKDEGDSFTRMVP